MITTPVLVNAVTIEDAWRQAVSRLLKENCRTGLIVYMEKPDMPAPCSFQKLDPSFEDPRIMSIADVANTIFPKKGVRWALDVSDFCEWYKRAYARRPSRAWGTYFERMIDYGPSSTNQLERIVNGLTGWGGKGGNYHAAFYLHLSGAELDRPKPLGSPCLQYVQLGSVGSDKLGMVVVYRSHDYFKKALGNFLGVSRVLHYCCEKAGKRVGPVTCVSSYAFLGGRKGDIRKMLSA